MASHTGDENRDKLRPGGPLGSYTDFTFKLLGSFAVWGSFAGLYRSPLVNFPNVFLLAIIIAVWVIGITVQEIKHVLQQGKERYLLAWWHLAVIPMIMCYIISAVLWIVGYVFIASESGSWTVLLGSTSLAPYHLLLLSNSFYSFAVVLTFFEASHVLLVNSTMGPLKLSLMNMFRDIMKFFALCALNVFAFTLAFRKLYSQYVQTSTEVTKNNNITTSHAFERYLTLSLNVPMLNMINDKKIELNRFLRSVTLTR